MSACISRHGEYSEHTPDAEWFCTLCGDVDTAGLRAEVGRLRAGIEDIRDEAWEPWLNRDWQHLDTVRNDCNALLNPTEGETDG